MDSALDALLDRTTQVIVQAELPHLHPEVGSSDGAAEDDAELEALAEGEEKLQQHQKKKKHHHNHGADYHHPRHHHRHAGGHYHGRRHHTHKEEQQHHHAQYHHVRKHGHLLRDGLSQRQAAVEEGKGEMLSQDESASGDRALVQVLLHAANEENRLEQDRTMQVDVREQEQREWIGPRTTSPPKTASRTRQKSTRRGQSRGRSRSSSPSGAASSVARRPMTSSVASSRNTQRYQPGNSVDTSGLSTMASHKPPATAAAPRRRRSSEAQERLSNTAPSLRSMPPVSQQHSATGGSGIGVHKPAAEILHDNTILAKRYLWQDQDILQRDVLPRLDFKQACHRQDTSPDVFWNLLADLVPTRQHRVEQGLGAAEDMPREIAEDDDVQEAMEVLAFVLTEVELHDIQMETRAQMQAQAEEMGRWNLRNRIAQELSRMDLTQQQSIRTWQIFDDMNERDEKRRAELEERRRRYNDRIGKIQRNHKRRQKELMQRRAQKDKEIAEHQKRRDQTEQAIERRVHQRFDEKSHQRSTVELHDAERKRELRERATRRKAKEELIAQRTNSLVERERADTQREVEEREQRAKRALEDLRKQQAEERDRKLRRQEQIKRRVRLNQRLAEAEEELQRATMDAKASRIAQQQELRLALQKKRSDVLKSMTIAQHTREAKEATYERYREPGPGEYLRDVAKRIGGGKISTTQRMNAVVDIPRHIAILPGPNVYGAPKVPDVGGGRFSEARPKTDVEWKMHFASQLPGPGQYKQASKKPSGGKFNLSRPKGLIDSAVHAKKDLPAPHHYQEVSVARRRTKSVEDLLVMTDPARSTVTASPVKTGGDAGARMSRGSIGAAVVAGRKPSRACLFRQDTQERIHMPEDDTGIVDRPSAQYSYSDDRADMEEDAAIKRARPESAASDTTSSASEASGGAPAGPPSRRPSVVGRRRLSSHGLGAVPASAPVTPDTQPLRKLARRLSNVHLQAIS